MQVDTRTYVMMFLYMLALPSFASSQLPESAVTAVAMATQYRKIPNLTYHKANDWEVKLDLYLPRGQGGPSPTLVYYTGGGWVIGDKDGNASLRILPYLEMGFAVANVSYRLASVAPAPAAAVDAVCALRWVSNHSLEYNLDAERIVVSGDSAGGHLALFAAMAPHDLALTSECASVDEMMQDAFSGVPLPRVEVAAVVNWYGITDVLDVLMGPNAKVYAKQWVGGQADPMRIARLVSPLNYVSRQNPPVLSVHGDADPVVPYQHAVGLHAALEEANISNRLVTIRGGGHGDFSQEQYHESYTAIREFLRQQEIWRR